MPNASTQTRRKKKIVLIKKNAISEAFEFVEKLSKAQEWAFDKSFGMRELRKRQMKNYLDFEEFEKEFKEKQQPALLLQKQWNDFWRDKEEKFRYVFRDTIRNVNVENQQYYRRLKLIQKNVAKIQVSVAF